MVLWDESTQYHQQTTKTVRKYSRNRTWASQDAMRLIRAPKLHQVFIKGISALQRTPIC